MCKWYMEQNFIVVVCIQWKAERNTQTGRPQSSRTTVVIMPRGWISMRCSSNREIGFVKYQDKWGINITLPFFILSMNIWGLLRIRVPHNRWSFFNKLFQVDWNKNLSFQESILQSIFNLCMNSYSNIKFSIFVQIIFKLLIGTGVSFFLVGR